MGAYVELLPKRFRIPRYTIKIFVSSVASLPDESIEIGVLAKYRTLNQIDPIIWSDTDHRQRHPNDTFFEHLAELERRGREIEF